MDSLVIPETPPVEPEAPKGITVSDPVVISGEGTDEVVTQVVSDNVQPADEVAPDTADETPSDASAPDAASEKATPPSTKEVEAKGIDLKALAEEYQKNGGLTEESYRLLAEKGFPKETVDAYIEGQKALAEKYNNALAEKVGGKDTLNAILEWAGKNLSDREKATANYALASMDPEAAGLVLEGLKARYQAANGAPPKLITGQQAGASGSALQPFASAAEVSEAIRNPKYQTDPAYRDRVIKRLAITEL